jgi:hypothetical protein
MARPIETGRRPCQALVAPIIADFQRSCVAHGLRSAGDESKAAEVAAESTLLRTKTFFLPEDESQ